MRLLALSFLTIILTASTVNAQFAGGAGTVEDPYQIETIEQLQEIRNHTEKHFIQIADIDASDTQNGNEGKGFIPIGDEVVKFTGSYDGGGYVINRLYIDRPEENNVGLFGYAEGAEISRVGLTDSYVHGSSYVGGLVGRNEGTITDSYVEGVVNGGSSPVGGLVGFNWRGSITNSYAKGDVNASHTAGGLVGWNLRGSITISFAKGNVTGRDGLVGGLVGLNERGSITNSYAKGDLNASYSAGGLVGRNEGTITDSYAEGNVNGRNYFVGGLVGWSNGTIINSSAEGNVTGGSWGIGGLLGTNRGSITNSYAEGDVNGDDSRVGGLVGENYSTITASYSTGSVIGEDAVGGFVGANSPDGQIRNSFSTGKASGNDDVGGFVGLNGATIETSFWDTETSEMSNGVGRGSTGDLTGLTSDQMTGVAAYGSMTALDFEETWHLTEGYPALQWQEDVVALPLPPRPVSLFQPGEAAVNQAIIPVFKWIEENRAEQYIIQVSENDDFETLIIDHVLSDTSYTPETPLDYETTYFWKIIAENQSGTSTSEIWSFTTRPELPEPIVLVSPGKDAINVPLMPAFIWREDFIANTYDFQLSGSDDFSELLADAQELSDTTLTLADSLDYLTNYYWRVRGIGELGEGEWSDAWVFNTVIEKPKPVALASPDSGATDISIEPLLTWIASERAEYYRIILATDAVFEAMVEDTTGIEATSFSPKTLSYNTDYFWKVKAINVGGESEWSETWSFFTEYALDTPELVSPDDQAEELPLPVTFYWQPVEDAKNYELQVARDGNFENLLDISRPEGLAKQVNTNQEAQAQDWNISQKVESLDYSTQYFWRVRATGDEGISGWSQARSLTTEDAPITDPVVLSSPADESTDVAFPVTLEWEAFDDADHYDIQISESSEFLLYIGKNEHDATSFITSDIKDTTTYFWRVRATVDDQKSVWSEVWSFTTGYVIDAITVAPDLVTPEDGALRQPLSLYLLWRGVPDAEGYQVEVARESDFEELVYPSERSKLVDGANSVSSDNISITDSKYALHIDGLDHDQAYYWRVRGINAQGEGLWSEVWSFNTKRETDTSPELLSPANESEDLEMPVRLTWNEYDQANHYDLELAVSPSFDSTLSYRSLPATSFDIAALSDTTRYFWRVRATVDEQKTAWSQVWTFTTELRVPDIPVWEPQDGQSDVELTPLLVWGASERAEMYDLQLSDDPGFSNLIIDESELPDTEYQVTGELEKGVRYYWKVRAGNQSGYSEWSDVLSFITVAPTSVEQDELPISYELKQNYPNPFNPSTQIRFALPEQAHVRLAVYNMLGQQVATLVNETRPAGWHDVTFDASGLSSGVFIYRLEADGQVKTRQMMFVK